jgi:hypothetical protein
MRITFLLSFGLLLVACNKNETPVLIPEKDTATVVSQTMTVKTILTRSRDTTMTAPDTTHTFGNRDTIHGTIHTDNAPEGTMLVGRWYYLKTGQRIAENSARLSAGTNLSHFDLMNESAWPLGDYKLLVIIDSTIKDSAQFSIENRR